MKQNKELDHSKYRKMLDDQYMRAMTDAAILGYGFIAVKRIHGAHDFSIRHVPWVDVKKALEDLGVIGALGGVDR